MDKYTTDHLQSLMEMPANQKCFDCGALHPKWASVNNAVYLCLNCAGIHRGFGVNVSFVRSLTMDSWDSKQVKLMSLGGNSRLKTLLDEFSVPENADPEFRYFIYLVDYYRRLLKSELTGDEPPHKPDVLEALELLNFTSTDKGSNSYKPISSADFAKEEEIEKPKKKEKKGFFGKIGSFFEETGKDIKKAAKGLGEKVDNLKIGDKLKTAGTKTVNAFKKAGDKIADTGKGIINSEFVQDVSHKAENGFTSFVKKTKKFFGGKAEEDEKESEVEAKTKQDSVVEAKLQEEPLNYESPVPAEAGDIIKDIAPEASVDSSSEIEREKQEATIAENEFQQK